MGRRGQEHNDSTKRIVLGPIQLWMREKCRQCFKLCAANSNNWDEWGLGPRGVSPLESLKKKRGKREDYALIIDKAKAYDGFE